MHNRNGDLVTTVAQIIARLRMFGHEFIPRSVNGAFRKDNACFICGKSYERH